jgi:acyl-CoA synthetase (AMP-forming)/AMP-acid ligase II
VDVIAAHAGRRPDDLALVEGARTLTWRALLVRRNRLANALAAGGLAAGEHAVVYAHNSLENLLAGAACRALGVIPVPMNHRLTRDEAAYVLDDADAVAVFVDDAFLPMAARLRTDAPRVRTWITLGRERVPWAEPVDDLLARGAETAPPTPTGQGLGGSMVYTAGTTGKPKGARRTTTDPAGVVERLRALDLAEPGHVHLVAGPLYHSAPGGFALYSQLFGATLVVMPRFDPEGALALIARHRCTSTFMAPTLLQRIVDLPAEVRARHDVSSMRVIVVAGAPCPMRVKEAAVAHFGPVPPGTPGELHVRRYGGVFDGYWKKPEATRETARGEWLSVGDVAWMDEEGFVYVCDRKRDMIISGGVNIYPAEIEDALHRHPAILDVAVFGVPDDAWGERVHAAVQLRPGAALTAAELQAFARERLAGYKVPREVSFHDTFPRDSAGKLLKRVLREPYWAGRRARV